MSRIPENVKKVISNEIEKVAQDLFYFPIFIEKIDKIIETIFGSNSFESNKLFEMNKKYMDITVGEFQATGKIDKESIEETMRNLVQETVIFLKTLM